MNAPPSTAFSLQVDAGSPLGTKRYHLIAFGDLEGVQGRVLASQVFDTLTKNAVWYLTRESRILSQGDRVLFYQNGRGVRGTAAVASIGDLLMNDVWLLDSSTRGLFKKTLALEALQVFERPVSLRDIIADLEFIKNKVYWGLSLKTSPRSISERDFQLIIRLCQRDGSV